MTNTSAFPLWRRCNSSSSFSISTGEIYPRCGVLHLRRYTASGVPLARGGATVLFAFNPESNLVLISVAKCDNRDNYQKLTGLTMAQDRLVKRDPRFTFQVNLSTKFLRDLFTKWNSNFHFPKDSNFEQVILGFVASKATQFVNNSCNAAKVSGYYTQ